MILFAYVYEQRCPWPGLTCSKSYVDTRFTLLYLVKQDKIGCDANLAEDKSLNLIMLGLRINDHIIWYIKYKNIGV